MPRKFVRRGRRVTRRRRVFRRRPAKLFQRRVLNVVNKMGEHKYLDTTGNGDINFAAPQVLHLTDIDQGDTVNLRQGNKVLITSFTFRIWLVQNTSSDYGFASGSVANPTTAVAKADFAQMVRLVMFVDTRPVSASASPAYGNVFQAAAGNVTDVLSPINMPTAGRFKILMNKWVTFDSGMGQQSKLFKWYKRMRHTVKYTGTNGGTDRDRGQLYLMMISSDNNLKVGFRTYMRITFSDF